VPAKLLIADDSTAIQKVFERTFPPEEFTLSFANNGEEALTKARTEKPQVIIADINMPAKSGFELCAALKQEPALKNIPVLLLIGILDDFDEDESQRVGADGFIIKPFEANAAVSKVREALSKGGITPPTEGPTAGQTDEIVELADIVEEPPSQEKGAEDIVELANIVEEPTPAAPSPPPKKGAEDILDLADILEETPAAPQPPPPDKAEEVMDLTDTIEQPTPTPPPTEKTADEIFELPDIPEETPTAPQPPPKKKQEDEAFVLHSSLRELEEELKSEFPEQQAEGEEELTAELPEELAAMEDELSGQKTEEEFGSLELDLPFDEMDAEPQAKDADLASMFGELGIESSDQEITGERLETILDESASELEKIEGLGTRTKTEVPEEEFTQKFREPLFGENPPKGEEMASHGPAKKEEVEEEFAEKFMEDFEPVFEPDEDLQRIDVLEKDLKGISTVDEEDLVKSVTSALSRELTEVVEEVIKNKVPILVRQAMERSKKE